MRFNPATRRDLDYDGLIKVYTNFLTEVQMLSNSNHTNIATLIQSLRDRLGDLYIIMEYYDGDLKDMRLRDLGEGGKYYEEEQVIEIFRQIC